MSSKTLYHTVLLRGQSVDETTSTPVGPGIAPRGQFHTFYNEWGTGVTAGVVEIETASHADYTGTWKILKTFTYASGAPHSDVFTYEGPLGAVRARISTAIANGSTTTTYVGN